MVDAAVLSLVPDEEESSFAVGEVVRTPRGNGFVVDDNGDPEEGRYTVLTFTGLRLQFDGSELELWQPRVGERVTLKDNTDTTLQAGTVMQALKHGICTVQWDKSGWQPGWDSDDLLPVCETVATYAKDDKVVCINPHWSTGLVGSVLEDRGGVLFVIWDRLHFRYAGQHHGAYPKDMFVRYDESAFSDAA